MFSVKNDIKTLKIGDFGLSIHNETVEQGKCGTLIYLSPEQINEYGYDQSVDTWACGFILYILCSGGKHPFYDRKRMNSDKYKETIRAHKEFSFPEGFPM